MPWRNLVLVIATASLASMTISMGIPLLSLVMEREGFDTLTIGVNTAAGGLAIFIVAPFIGRILRRLGLARGMAAALAGAALLLLLFPLHVDPWLWFGLRLLLGCCGGVLFVLSETAVNALAPTEIRGRVLGAYGTAFSIGYTGGPLILASVGSEGMLPFVIASAILFASIPPVLFSRGLDDRLGGADHGSRGGLTQFTTLWRRVPLPFATVFVYAVIETAFFAFLPVLALSHGQSETAAAGLLSVWLAGNVVCQLPLGWLADRLPRARVIAACAIAAVLLLAIAPWTLGTGPLGWLTFFVMGGTMGALYTLSLSVLGDGFAPGELARANTAFVMTFQIGLLLGPASVGAIMRASSIDALTWALILPLAVLAVAAGGLARRPIPAAPTVGDTPAGDGAP